MKKPLYKATNVLLQTFLFTIYIIIYIVSKIINKMDKTTSQHTVSTNDTRTNSKSPSYNAHFCMQHASDSIRQGVATQKMPYPFVFSTGVATCAFTIIGLLQTVFESFFYFDLCTRIPSLLCFDITTSDG